MSIAWDDFAALVSAPVTMTLRGRVYCVDDPTERIAFAPPDRWRVEDDDGRLRYLGNDAGYHQWRAGVAGLACFQPRTPGSWHGGGVNSTALIRPRDLTIAPDDDFTRPAGPVEEIGFIGRPAWRVLLEPPPRKPEAVWQIVDVESGITLAFQSPDGTVLIGFTDLATRVTLPPDTFTLPRSQP